MAYSVKEIYFTLQGEGAQTGRGAVFCRFSGCNLWTGREADRAGAQCNFCDTDFVGTDGPGGGVFDTALALATAVKAAWPAGGGGARPLVVCTGGEPLLQLDEKLIAVLHEAGFEIAVETNGTLAAPDGIDWLTVSPKAGASLVQGSGDELKLIFPQVDLDPESLAGFETSLFFLQPMDGPDKQRNTELTLAYCRTHPRWRLSLQIHKLLGIA